MTEKCEEGRTGPSKPVLVLRRGEQTPGTADDNVYQTNVGEAFGLQAVIVIYVDGEPVGEVAPIAVEWGFLGGGGYVAGYQPAVAAAAPNENVNLSTNPVELYYWSGTSTPVSIECAATAPDGEVLQEGGELTIISNTYNFVGGTEGNIQIGEVEGVTYLSYGDPGPGGTPGFAVAFETAGGAAYPGWLGAIQLVSSVRQFTGQSGNVYPVVNTQGEYLLDAAATDQDYVYSKVQVGEGQTETYTFNDTPNNQLLSVINGDPIVSFTVNESFQLYIVFNGSPAPDPNADAGQIWFPTTAAIGWGWQATATNNQGIWSVTNPQTWGPDALNFGFPAWQGTIRDVALRSVPRRITMTRTVWEGGSPGPSSSASPQGERARE